MVVIGAKGHAKEILEVLYQNGISEVVFFDDVSNDLPTLIFDKYRILRSIEQVRTHFTENEPSFILGVGNPEVRFKLQKRFISIGGVMKSAISPKAVIGHFGNSFGNGLNIMTGSIITNNIIIEEGVLINMNVTIAHDSKIGRYTELSPGVNVSGNCHIGEFCSIGTNAAILPKITLGNNVIVGAGAVVTRDVPDNTLVAGVPARRVRAVQPIIIY